MSTVWETETTNGEGGDYEVPPSGSHPAYCIGLIDLGTHDQTFNNETKPVHKILIVWELTAEHQQNGETFIVHRDFNWSLNTGKAKLRQFLEAWQGRTFNEGEKIDLASFVKQPCVLSLSEGLSAKQKKFVEIASCSKPMRGLTVPPMTVPPILFSIAEHRDPRVDPPIPDCIPPLYGRKIIDEIKKSKEWAAMPPF